MDGEGIGREGVGKCVPIGEEECQDCEADTSEEGEGRKGVEGDGMGGGSGVKEGGSIALSRDPSFGWIKAVVDGLKYHWTNVGRVKKLKSKERSYKIINIVSYDLEIM